MPAMQSLRELFVHELSDIYSAEKQITEALPKMAKAASDPGLQKAFELHLKETEGQIARLDKIFKLIDESPKRIKCKGMEGLIEEGSELVKAAPDSDADTIDAGLIGAAQRVEHYEMAAYGTVRNFAKTLGEDEVATLLQETLDEEGAADKKLTSLADNNLNAQAVS